MNRPLCVKTDVCPHSKALLLLCDWGQSCEGRVDVGQMNADYSPQCATCLGTPVPGGISGNFFRCVGGKNRSVEYFLFLAWS